MINIIVAAAKNNVIGKNGYLPWNLKLDMARFKQLTMDNVVIFGANTFNEINKPLAGRINIVLSSKKQFIDGVVVCRSINEALNYASKTDKEIFICGGESIYRQTMEKADRIYLTRINEDFDGDRFFPEIPKAFELKLSQNITDGSTLTTFCIYERK